MVSPLIIYGAGSAASAVYHNLTPQQKENFIGFAISPNLPLPALDFPVFIAHDIPKDADIIIASSFYHEIYPLLLTIGFNPDLIEINPICFY